VSHSILNAFKNLACASIASGFGFKEADALVSAAKNAPAAGAPANAAPAKEEKKPEKKVEEEEVDMDMGDMFGY